MKGCSKVASTITIVFLILAKSVGGFNAASEKSNQHVTKQNRENVNNNGSKTDTHRLAKRMDLELCLGQFDIHQNTIIRTGESQAIGGKYLQGLELDTIEECQRLCCETESCDVYIFENKNNGYCYLFECGSPENFHCKFTRHANYTSAVLTPVVKHVSEIVTSRPSVPPTQSVISKISQQEWELTNLKLKQETQKKTFEVTPPTKSPSQDTQRIPEVVVNNAQTIDSSSGNMQPKVLNVTHTCGRFQFACHSGECIAVYNACDGIPQCDDGSDEGIECSNAGNNAGVVGAASNTKLEQKNAAVNTKSLPLATQYESVVMQQETPQQQLQNMQQQQQQHQQQQSHNTLDIKHSVNNREDANAWENRKVLLTSQQQIEDSNGENDGTISIADKPNVNAHVNGNDDTFTAYVNNKSDKNGIHSSTLEQSGLYAPQAPIYQPINQDHIIPPANSNWHQQGIINRQQQNQQTELSLPGQLQQLPVVLEKTNYIQQSQKLAIAEDEQKEHQTKVSSLNGLPKQSKSPTISGIDELNSMDKVAKAAHENLVGNSYEYDDEEEKSTEPPKKKPRKHRKTKSKSAKSIEYAVQKFQTPSDTAAMAVHHNAAAYAPVHEQYKVIHENLAMEFRDHDGLSDRPGGAVLSLTLGVLITAALAILIGCRLRTVGRRARRLGGKTPYAHEADFLVNGMYL
uniref:MANSC domain-containing protein n=1 Tax=Glossina austeni TaxID=7395 RepID=A0A1A9UMI6_GLOAU